MTRDGGKKFFIYTYATEQWTSNPKNAIGGLLFNTVYTIKGKIDFLSYSVKGVIPHLDMTDCLVIKPFPFLARLPTDTNGPGRSPNLEI